MYGRKNISYNAGRCITLNDFALHLYCFHRTLSYCSTEWNRSFKTHDDWLCTVMNAMCTQVKNILLRINMECRHSLFIVHEHSLYGRIIIFSKQFRETMPTSWSKWFRCFEDPFKNRVPKKRTVLWIKAKKVKVKDDMVIDHTVHVKFTILFLHRKPTLISVSYKFAPTTTRSLYHAVTQHTYLYVELVIYESECRMIY